MTVDVEAKAKELAVVQLMDALGKERRGRNGASVIEPDLPDLTNSMVRY